MSDEDEDGQFEIISEASKQCEYERLVRPFTGTVG
jgi:hypothetical protein